MASPVKIKCYVSSIINHDNTVSTVSLQPYRRLPNFKPGQFLHLALDPFDPAGGFWPESRVFSIASTPHETELVIAYAVKGTFTRRMREELTLGKEVWIRLPYGHFNLAGALGDEIILVAGGTGITPFISFISHEIYRPSGVSLKLVYGVRKPELFIFEDVLLSALGNLKGFRCIAFSEAECDNQYPFPVGKGSLSHDEVWQAADEPLKATYYLAGPIAMIEAFKVGLSGMGVKSEKIRIDEWE